MITYEEGLCESNNTSFLEHSKNVSKSQLIKTISETSENYDTVTLGNYILIRPSVATDNSIKEFKTMKEVSIVDQKIVSIYNWIIYGSIIITIISLGSLYYNLFNIPIEILCSVILFTIIGSFSFKIGLNNYNNSYEGSR